MNWLNKIMRSGQGKSHKQAVAAPAAPAPRPAPADPQQIRQRLAAAPNGDEREQLERELGTALAQTRQPPHAEDSARVRSCAIARLSDKASALSWLAELSDEDGLAEVALRARLAEVRLAAAKRLVAPALLERVALASRDKDKGVYRHCATALRERQAASDCAVRAAALERELDAMLATDPVSAAQLVDMEKQCKLLTAGDAGRCAELIEQLRLRVQEQAQQLRAVHASQVAAQTLTADLARHPLQEAYLQELQDRWRTLAGTGAAWPAWLGDHKDAVALRRLLGDIELRLADARADLERLSRCSAFLDSREQDESLDEAVAAAWEALEKPSEPQLRTDLQLRWEACLKRLAKPVEVPLPPALPPAPTAPPPRDDPRLKSLVSQLEQAIEQGSLAEASRVDGEIAGVETASSVSRHAAQRLARARAQLGKLRGWARWGSDQARQQLIHQAEQLAQAESDIDSLSKMIAKLREEWKSLDMHGASARALWVQFDAAVEKAYAPVAAHRAALAARHEAAREAKEALCREWEDWLAQVSWEHADFKVIQARRQEMCDVWRAAAKCAGREEQKLRKRFDALLAGLDAPIEAARREEVGRCEALIAAAEAQRENPNLRQATDAVKTLQQRWRDDAAGVRLARSHSEQLWQRFRAACNAVFARRDAEKAEQLAQRAQDAEQAHRHLADLENLLAGEDLAQLQQALTEFRNAAGEARPAALTAAAKGVVQRAEARLRALQAAKRRAPFLLMTQKLALVERVERAAAAGEDIEGQLGDAQAAWQTMPRLPEKYEQPLARRLAAAAGATASTLAAGHALREELLLDLEIALGLRSPDAQDQSRRARQLQLLQQKFRRDRSQPADLEKMIVDWHATAASADAQQQQRMAVVLQSLDQHPTGL